MGRETIQFLTFDDLRDFIESNVPQAPLWGQGDAKTIEYLWEEIQERDTILTKDGQRPLRVTWPAFINVFYSDSGLGYVLFEEEQILRDGRKRVRSLPGSIGEKGKLKEKPIKTARRAISEELDTLPLSLKDARLVFDRRWGERESARSYPGLLTQSHNTLFRLYLQPDQGIPAPFKKNEREDVLFFNWRQDPSSVQRNSIFFFTRKR